MKSLAFLLLAVAAASAVEHQNATIVIYSYPDYDTWSNVRLPYEYKHWKDFKEYKEYKEYKDYKDYKQEYEGYKYKDSEYKDRSFYSPLSYFYRMVGLRDICEKPIVYFIYNHEHNYLSGCVLENGFYEITEKQCSPEFLEHLHKPGEKVGLIFFEGAFHKTEFRDYPIKHLEFPTGVRLSSARRLQHINSLPYFLVVDSEYFPVYNRDYLQVVGRLEVSDYVKILRDRPMKEMPMKKEKY